MPTNTTMNRLLQQEAFIRTLLDEIDRCAESEPRVAALREQIQEEESRLDLLLAESTAAA
jgi:hypothetical protein